MIEYEPKTKEKVSRKMRGKLMKIACAGLTLAGLSVSLTNYSLNRDYFLERKVIKSLNPYADDPAVEKYIASSKNIDKLDAEFYKKSHGRFDEYMDDVNNLNNLRAQLTAEYIKSPVLEYHDWNERKPVLVNDCIVNAEKANKYVTSLGLLILAGFATRTCLNGRKEIKNSGSEKGI